MELKEIMELQYKFDEKHAGKFEWSIPITENTINILAFLIVAMTGEIGELSNIVKKILRGDHSLEDSKEQIKDELVDIFIYLIKICNQMSINLEEVFFNKLEQNIARFRQYEKND
jgi:NTP pyrophosphatase (non-canonical NTP hydrolase)